MLSSIFFDLRFFPLLVTCLILASKFAHNDHYLNFYHDGMSRMYYCFCAEMKSKNEISWEIQFAIFSSSSSFYFMIQGLLVTIYILHTSGFLNSTDFPVVVVNLLLWWLPSMSLRRIDTLENQIMIRELLREHKIPFISDRYKIR